MSASKSMSASKRKRQQGFTLIEVLVSIAIFATLSVAAYQVVNQVQRSNQLSQERSARLNELQRAVVMMDNDFRQMALRPMRTNGENPASKLIVWADYLLDSDSKGVMFARLGWHNPQQQFPRGEVTKVGYRIKDDMFERVWWRYPDTPTGQMGVITPLLSGVETFEMRFSDGKKWSDEWDAENTLPAAVSVELTLKDYGKISRVYLTPEGTLQKRDGSGSQDSKDDNNG
ncbi:type II secretion system minor pseudopilin GspJ [Vibrio navarrensis]|uniref:Type II secretion system protein J n=1 Tax=Vibrio navarrensis TaxID=29495 RepID=A0A099LP92_9VIBR|nr:type II secretion system minor pseudopilin GspJ [Vibrio navarrensis]KGK10043.1 general secretion pathway protein GspJ [Vibrio navarrensis]MBE4615419.1 type II secretion system protein GspJ [Vibrio navarrensis]QOD69963.1 type II secretion system minor pseudopilin GspJ [Vibrio navarrensis]